MALHVVELTTAQTHPLRLAVLRADTPTRGRRFAEDTWPGVCHLGVVDGGGSWRPARGSLVRWSTSPRSLRCSCAAWPRSQTHAGRGSVPCCWWPAAERARADRGQLVWANARDTALAFYAAHGFVVVGDGFVDARPPISPITSVVAPF